MQIIIKNIIDLTKIIYFNNGDGHPKTEEIDKRHK
jgi:hypothetical protein